MHARPYMNMPDTGRKVPLRLSAAKSSMGHAEPAAGGIGVAHVMFMITQFSNTGLIHLRNINPIILGALKMDVHEQVSLPREVAPSIGLSRTIQDVEQMHGISSFAFQGTNAHIVLSMRGFGQGECTPERFQKAALWLLQRHWYIGPSHQLLSAATCVGSLHQCIFKTTAFWASLGKYTLKVLSRYPSIESSIEQPFHINVFISTLQMPKMHKDVCRVLE